jgi:hypothetical protein
MKTRLSPNRWVKRQTTLNLQGVIAKTLVPQPLKFTRPGVLNSRTRPHVHLLLPENYASRFQIAILKRYHRFNFASNALRFSSPEVVISRRLLPPLGFPFRTA